MLFIVAVRRVPPHFHVKPPAEIEVELNKTITIDCQAVGSPMPVVRWRKGYMELKPNEEAPHGKNILEIDGLRESTNFTCVAQSELGNIEANVFVKVKGEWHDGSCVSSCHVVRLLLMQFAKACSMFDHVLLLRSFVGFPYKNILQPIVELLNGLPFI